MAEETLVTITINGKEIEVPSTLNLIQAAAQAEVEIPHFCYHPYLSAPAVCRMCLVEVEGVAKLQPACNLPLAEGLAVRTDTPAVKDAVREVLEFTLINHPLDCPICDQAGECGLHDYYQDYGLYNSSFKLPKVHKPKVVSIGPTLTLDAERCILCSRCVRFCEEITQTHEMAIVNRGEHAEIQAVKEVDNPYSVNLADICPVGALTEDNFRFRVRRWYLQSSDSVCPGCARGCSTTLDHFRGQVQRMRPRENPAVNAAWMCDAGRLFLQRLQQGRLLRPMVRENGQLQAATWDEALEAAAHLLRQAGGAIAAQGSAHGTNEEALALATLLQTLEAPAAASLRPSPPGWDDDDLLRRADRTPNRKGASYFCGDTPWETLLPKARVALLIREDIQPQRQSHLLGTIALSAHITPTVQAADVILPVADWAESSGSFTNFQGRVQTFQRAVPPPANLRPSWEVLHQLIVAVGGQSHVGAEDWFNALGDHADAFAGLRWSEIGPTGAWLQGHGSDDNGLPSWTPEPLSPDIHSRPWRLL